MRRNIFLIALLISQLALGAPVQTFTGQSLVRSTANGGPAADAQLEVRSTTKGMLPPRVTTTQRDAISTPTAGNFLYNSTTNLLNFFNGTSWFGLAKTPVAPTIQRFLSGSGTYTTPTSPAPIYIRPVLVGAGGGGGGSGTTSGTAGTAGGDTTFGTTLLVAGGGAAGARHGLGAAGGTASLGTGPVGLALPGGMGGGSHRAGGTVSAASPQIAGANGGSSAFGGAGSGGYPGGSGTGSAGATNTGGGGGGGYLSANNSAISGAGGGAGAYVDAIILSPAATYPYAVGAAGTGQAAGTNGGAGGNGGSGVLLVYEYYQ